ncbi:MAG: hypothetical protein JNM68_11860 [Dinghuibacter sp.]|nr:hypothetical protein [Dinghuibacter sp.]
MALPKEPRQKMINMMYIVLVALLALNVSAEILNAFKIVDKSLVSSSAQLTESNRKMQESLSQKLADEKLADRAKTWQPVARQTSDLAEHLFQMIEQYKGELRMAADAKTATDSVFREDNLDAASRLFNTSKQGEALFNAVANFKKQVLSLHPKLQEKFQFHFPLEVSGTAREWSYKNFNMVPAVAALTILSKLQNDIKTAENQVVSYCHEQLSATVYVPDTYGAIVSQNSDYFMPGGTITIKGSVGAYNKHSGTEVLVNGTPVPVGPNGVAELNLPVGATGTHTADITVKYTTQDGEPRTESKKITWNVGAPGAAAVMADKLNLMYTGVPNPITVSAGVGEDKIEAVRPSQGNIIKTGPGKYEVSGLTTEGDMTITIDADGKSTAFPFRVRSLPPPTAMVGEVKEGYMKAATFKAMKGVRAELVGAPINAQFRVISYDITVYNGGAPLSASNIGHLWNGNADRIANSVTAGATVTISKIVVEGPDKKQRSPGNPVILLKIN